MPAPDFELRTHRRDSAVEVAAAGELDMAAAFQLESGVDPLLADDAVDSVQLDLSEVGFVDSAGLGALLALRERAQDRGIALEIARPSDPVRRLLELTGLGDTLT
jgi:anti-sigma B factor antagonist